MRVKQHDLWLWFLIAILCIMAAGKVVVQDAPRIRFSALKQNDVQQLYLGSRVWMRGGNPYSEDALLSEMKQVNPDGVKELNGPCLVDCHLYYPPSALPLMVLPALLPWKSFHFVYLVVCVLAYLFTLYRLSLLIEKPVHRWLFFSLGLAFGPYHSGLDTNNISVLLIPILLLATLCLDSVWAFVLIGVVACLKPPLVLVLLFYYLLRRDVRALAVSATIILAISGIGLFQLRNISWFPAYLNSIRDYSAGGTRLGVTNHGVLNFGFSNLRALFYALSHSSHYASIANNTILVLLGVLFSWTVLRWHSPDLTLDIKILAISIVGCLTLFQSSLQYYNYVFLLGVALFALRYQGNGLRLGLMIGLCSFLFPSRFLLSLSSPGRDPIHAVLQLAHSGESGLIQLTRGQELLVCLPSVIFLLITANLIIAFQAKCKRVVLQP